MRIRSQMQNKIWKKAETKAAQDIADGEDKIADGEKKDR